ncbi:MULTISPECIES: diffusible signal factor-reguated Ax21 faimly protein [unclassified Lysobacter]|uniref:diffusible signal factor-reguated Ax21 faimly protein n=1 Tax=unclassified Lysobacter TaxID=2635362 RepID=UPI001C235218|nr:diffusible signal factor-reguated Ax21 faimly protein [Lysobacter sp. MMG2]MBU8977231.1 Ax21 family protein [Lysobacter sp. MMG2]
MKRSLLALTLLAALPFAASAAEGVSYNYIEGGYIANNGDNRPDADGWSVGGAGAIAPNFHVFGNYSSQEFDHNFGDLDRWRLGVGYNHEINSKVDLLTRVAYEKQEFDAIDLDGWSVEAGVRASLTPNLEGYALAGYEDYDHGVDGEFYGRLGAQVKFNQMWGVNGEVKFVDGYTEYFVGPRISF